MDVFYTGADTHTELEGRIVFVCHLPVQMQKHQTNCQI